MQSIYIDNVIIDESAFKEPEDVHAYLKERLSFPDYYGANFSALDDCLGDVCSPTFVTVVRSPDAPPALRVWFDRLCEVLVRCSKENDLLALSIREDEETPSAVSISN